MLEPSIAWIDFAEQDRRKMMEVVSLFRHRDTRDELGLGSIRDAFADLFFPGTTTLQTRARYFLFVPWLYLDYERRQVRSERVVRALEGDEIRLIKALTAAGEQGVIGQISGASLQRFPSSIYWNGLEQWGIRRYPGSQSQYHRWLDHFYESQRDRRRPEDGESITDGYQANWDLNLPNPPTGFLDRADLCLTLEEARYLRERLLISSTESLLTTIVERCDPVKDVAFIWQHPQLALFPEDQRAWIDHGRNFSEAMYGAVLLYNLMLAELRGDDDLIAEHRDELSEWWGELDARTAGLANWDRKNFWELVLGAGRIPIRTQRFVDSWLDLLLAAQDLLDLSQNQRARHLVHEREVWLKRGRSRFESRRHLEMWSGRAGLSRLDYRWLIARRITNDILYGLGRR